MKQYLNEFLSMFLSPAAVKIVLTPLSIILIAGLAILAYIFCHKVVSVIVKAVTERTATNWDDDILNDRLMRAFSQLAPALVVAYLLPGTFASHDKTFIWITKITEFYIVWALVHLACRALQNVYEAFDRRRKYRIHTLRGVFQIMKLIFICVGVIVGISILFDKSPIAILTAFGASAAVLMLVFKDTILGLVAGVQLTANDMLKKGDWIVMPKSGANGEVIDVSLTTVKVRNWDNSVTTIPPYTLVSESFQNFRPMQKSGARRVARSIYIDLATIGFVSPERSDALAAAGLITAEEAAAATRHVNIDLLRRYLERYLSHNSHVDTRMIYMVRQLQPTVSGLPLELYFFVNNTEWKSYEHIQAEIFNHVYAVIGEFGLAMYQAPAGADLHSLAPRTDAPALP